MIGKNKHKEATAGITGILLLYSLLALAPLAEAGSDHVTFHVDAYVADGYFSTDVSASGDTVTPGDKTTITFEAKRGGGSLYVELGSYGGATVNFDTPLTSVSIPVSGMTGIASVNVDLRGTLEGDLTVSGPGTLSINHLSWTSWGKKTVTLDASKAEEGDTIKVTLKLKYTGHIGAHGDTLLGDVTLISDQSLPGVAGSKSVVHTVKVQSSIFPGVPGFEIAIFLGAIGVVFLLQRKLKKQGK